MTQQDILAEIEIYKREDGSYDLSRMEKDFGVNQSIEDTFALFFGGEERVDSDPRIALAVEMNSRLYDQEKMKEGMAVQEALSRFVSGTSSLKDCLLLERKNLVIAVYGDPHSERPTGFRLKDNRDIDGNIYTDQEGLEEKPGRLS